MARRIDVLVSSGMRAESWNGAGTNYLIQTPTGVLYAIYVDGVSGSALSRVVFRKSTDNGSSWSGATVVHSSVALESSLAVWYDRWSNISAGLIHVAVTDANVDDTIYRTINTESSDALSTATNIFLGTSAATTGHLSIVRAVGGNVYCKTVIDAGTEGGFFRLPNANVPNGAWDAARTVDETIAASDQMILLPDFDAADTQDIMAIFWDASANEISRKLYDDSANSWAEASIATSMTELATTTGFANFAAAPDIGNTNHVLVAWSNTDTASARLQCWTIDSGAITALTDVVSSSTDDQGLCAICIDTVTGWWYVFYGGATAGTDTWASSMHIYYKVSENSGSTWGAETRLDAGAAMNILRSIYTCPRMLYTAPFMAAWIVDSSVDDLWISVDHTVPRAVSLAGVM